MAMKSTLILTSVILHIMSISFRGASAFTSTIRTTTMKRARDVNANHGGIASPGRVQCRRTMVAAPETSAHDPTNNHKNAASPKLTGKEVKAIYESSPPLYLAQGLLAVHKPLTWSSSDVVTYIRGILTRDAKDRGFVKATNQDGNQKSRRKKQIMMKVGHGGTLDPLASGVLVLGIGKGTTLLQDYLTGDKQYVASCELGYETDTLDAEGKLVKEAPWDHVKDMSVVESVIPKFTGKIEQVPPLYSAIRVDGQRLYEIARKDDSGEAAEKVEIPKREVEIHALTAGTVLEESVVRSGVVDGPRYREAAQKLEEEAAAKAAAAAAEAAAKAAEAAAIEAKGENADENSKTEEGSENKEGGGKKKKGRRGRNNKRQNNNGNKKNYFDEVTVPSVQSADDALALPRFTLELKCGGGTYVRSLVRDIGYELDTVATMTGLVRMKQGPFVLDDALRKEDWTAEKIYEAIREME